MVVNEAGMNRIEETLALDPKDPYALNERRSAEATSKQIKKLVKAVRRQRQWIAAREAKLDVMRDELQALLEASGTNWSDDDGYARLIPEGVRLSYDRDALDKLILRDPACYGWLNEFRKESKIRQSVAVK